MGFLVCPMSLPSTLPLTRHLLFVDGKKGDAETERTYVHRGMAQRSFTRSWTLSDETEVRSVTFEDGLLIIDLGKVVPEHQQRRDYL